MSEKIIQIAEARVRQGKTSYCRHINLTYSLENESIECLDCKSPIGAFKAFMILVRGFSRAADRLNAQRQEFAELKLQGISLIAAKRIENAWRKRKTVPACPHCGRGILATDNFGDISVSKEIELERRKFEVKP